MATAAWQRAFAGLGWATTTVAGEGPVDVVVPGLGLDDAEPPEAAALEAALAHADLVVVENLLTIPMRLEASRVAAAVLRGRPALLHHHDPPWQRARYAAVTELPAHDPAWRHVTINDLTRRQFAARGLQATTVYPGFDPDPPAGDRSGTRATLGLGPDDVLLLHPVRAIERKDVPAALALAAAVGGTYWLTGPPEEGYGPTLERLLAEARCTVLHQPATSMEDAYAACDAVLFPSTWEGFGQPPVEAAAHRRVAVVGDYPVAAELRAMGFRWLEPTDVDGLRVALAGGGLGAPEVLAGNHTLLRERLSPEALVRSLDDVLRDAGWGP